MDGRITTAIPDAAHLFLNDWDQTPANSNRTIQAEGHPTASFSNDINSDSQSTFGNITSPSAGFASASINSLNQSVYSEPMMFDMDGAEFQASIQPELQFDSSSQAVFRRSAMNDEFHPLFEQEPSQAVVYGHNLEQQPPEPKMVFHRPNHHLGVPILNHKQTAVERSPRNKSNRVQPYASYVDRGARAAQTSPATATFGQPSTKRRAQISTPNRPHATSSSQEPELDWSVLGAEVDVHPSIGIPELSRDQSSRRDQVEPGMEAIFVPMRLDEFRALVMEAVESAISKAGKTKPKTGPAKIVQNSSSRDSGRRI